MTELHCTLYFRRKSVKNFALFAFLIENDASANYLNRHRQAVCITVGDNFAKERGLLAIRIVLLYPIARLNYFLHKNNEFLRR
jgi:hypothetical protein